MAHSAKLGNSCQCCAVFTFNHFEAFTASYNTLKVDYERTDAYPEFPKLKASAKDGCIFCGLLRSSCQQYCPGDDAFIDLKNGKRPYQGNVQIQGAVFSSSAPSRGITTLEFNIHPIDTTDSSQYTTIYLNLYSCEDMTLILLM